MAYFNDSNNFYSPSTTPEEFYSYPFLWSRTLAGMDEVNLAAPTFADGWAAGDQPGSSAIASAGHLATSYGGQPSRLFIGLFLMCKSL